MSDASPVSQLIVSLAIWIPASTRLPRNGIPKSAALMIFEAMICNDYRPCFFEVPYILRHPTDAHALARLWLFSLSCLTAIDMCQTIRWEAVKVFSWITPFFRMEWVTVLMEDVCDLNWETLNTNAITGDKVTFLGTPALVPCLLTMHHHCSWQQKSSWFKWQLHVEAQDFYDGWCW